MRWRAPSWTRLASTGLGCLACLLACAACSDEATTGAVPADRDYSEFQILHPVLLRDCGFHACHGSEDRLFRVYGPGRARLDPDTRAFDGVTGGEASLSFTLALSMIDAEHPARSLLLRKPLSVAAGGAPHGGVDPLGRNVYRSTNDQGYQALERFVLELPPGEADESDESESP